MVVQLQEVDKYAKVVIVAVFAKLGELVVQTREQLALEGLTEFNNFPMVLFKSCTSKEILFRLQVRQILDQEKQCCTSTQDLWATLNSLMQINPTEKVFISLKFPLLPHLLRLHARLSVHAIHALQVPAVLGVFQTSLAIPLTLFVLIVLLGLNYPNIVMIPAQSCLHVVLVLCQTVLGVVALLLHVQQVTFLDVRQKFENQNTVCKKIR